MREALLTDHISIFTSCPAHVLKDLCQLVLSVKTLCGKRAAPIHQSGGALPAPVTAHCQCRCCCCCSQILLEIDREILSGSHRLAPRKRHSCQRSTPAPSSPFPAIVLAGPLGPKLRLPCRSRLLALQSVKQKMGGGGWGWGGCCRPKNAFWVDERQKPQTGE